MLQAFYWPSSRSRKDLFFSFECIIWLLDFPPFSEVLERWKIDAPSGTEKPLWFLTNGLAQRLRVKANLLREMGRNSPSGQTGKDCWVFWGFFVPLVWSMVLFLGLSGYISHLKKPAIAEAKTLVVPLSLLQHFVGFFCFVMRCLLLWCARRAEQMFFCTILDKRLQQ